MCWWCCWCCCCRSSGCCCRCCAWYCRCILCYQFYALIDGAFCAGSAFFEVCVLRVPPFCLHLSKTINILAKLDIRLNIGSLYLYRDKPINITIMKKALRVLKRAQNGAFYPMLKADLVQDLIPYLPEVMTRDADYYFRNFTYATLASVLKLYLGDNLDYIFD